MPSSSHPPTRPISAAQENESLARQNPNLQAEQFEGFSTFTVVSCCAVCLKPQHLGFSPRRDIEMPGRGAAAAGEPVQKEGLDNFFTTRAIIKFLNHHFA